MAVCGCFYIDVCWCISTFNGLFESLACFKDRNLQDVVINGWIERDDLPWGFNALSADHPGFLAAVAESCSRV
ncbi:hypothetical protein B0B36_26425 [Pseudomonas syringae pv. actinidifoliorum]|nr:hypothetical protein [Pseudomonas syringae pv. theae]NAT59556.1 hypothetical protein [Pseudomonas syringae pv. actinidifoliorum]MBL3835254.1 hypothetical protein [Pseudomonas syringae pv. theae]MBL3867592.1 hypothetical protein [Pseudomonas syringae pv. theae]MBL3872123.1 hypothetical protein [Pseudomonas syringae pv. theae]